MQQRHPDAPFTTIGTWSSGDRDVELDGERYSWRKRDEWERIVDLPRTSGVSFTLAMDVWDPADLTWLEAHGWAVRDPIAIRQRFMQGLGAGRKSPLDV